jgi:hypothetical protein
MGSLHKSSASRHFCGRQEVCIRCQRTGNNFTPLGLSPAPGEGNFQGKVSAMPLLYIVGLLIVVGVLLWLVNNYIPMDPKIKGLLNAVVVIAVVIYLLQVFGLLGTLENIKVGHMS